MNLEALFSLAGDKVVRVGLNGVGDFGASFLAQSRNIPNLEISLVCDKDAERMHAAVSATDMCASDLVMTRDLMDEVEPRFDVLVEATGHPEVAAGAAEWAIGHKRHVVMASKEAAIVVGPILHDLARRQGVVYTEVEGDQPSLLIGLISWAKSLGLKVRVAGKSSEYDFVVDEEDCLEWRGSRSLDSGVRDLWHKDQRGWPKLCEKRHEVISDAGFPARTVSDFCEMGVVANATGLVPDCPGLHAPLLRPKEIADVFQHVAEGGILREEGRIDVFNCLRRPDEISFAGGVFVVVGCDNKKTWELLREKGHVVARNGRSAMLYNPQHLLGVEAPMSILCAALLGLPTGAVSPRPVVDLVARTSRDFSEGEVLSVTDQHHHEVARLSPELIPAIALGDANPCPYYLAVGQKLREDVPMGTILTNRMLELDFDQQLYRLRQQQDQLFCNPTNQIERDND